MAIRLVEENQHIAFYKANERLYQIIVTDLDRSFLSGRDIVCHHVRMVSYCVWRDMQCLYRLGHIIQEKYPATIKTINWRITYFNAEYADYISKLATFNFSLGVNSTPIDYTDRIIAEIFDIGEQERLNAETNQEIVKIVNQQMNEYRLRF